MRAQKSACSASRAEYMKVKAKSHTEAKTVRLKNAALTREVRRISTVTPKRSINAVVTAVGIAYGEKTYAPRSSNIDVGPEATLLWGVVKEMSNEAVIRRQEVVGRQLLVAGPATSHQ